MSLAEKILNKLFRKREIVNCERDIYLHRWFVIKTPWIGVYIHKFMRSDEDRALHDHPWPFLVIPIWMGYWEHSCSFVQHPGCEPLELPEQRRVYPILGTRLRPATFRHRVELLPRVVVCPECDKASSDLNPVTPQFILSREGCTTCNGKMFVEVSLPAWSLFIRFKRIREWGFWPVGGWVSWKQWWNDQCED